MSDNQNLVSRAWYYIHITADPVDADTVYVNNLDFWKSSDGGKTFTEIATPHGDNHDLWIDPTNNQRMIQGNDGGANVSFNGGYSFSTIYNQPTAQFYHLAHRHRGPLYGLRHPAGQHQRSACRAGSITAAITAGRTRSSPAPARAATCVPTPDDPDIVYVGAIGSSPGGGNSLQRYDRSIDQIRLITTWPEDDRGVGAGEWKQRFAWTYPIVISPHDPEHDLHRRRPRASKHRTRARAGSRSAPI